ncbi:unnamed protein product [Debaryomyces tyrocola]|nr:unnamed protein product [Debaryomyces tyrocola]
MKTQSNKLAANKETAPESEEQKFKQKCKELKKRITEVEESNEVATLALSRTKMTIRRLRLEYAVLLERLEQRAIMIPDGNTELEDMSPPPSPTILDESLNTTNAKLTRNGLSKRGGKKAKGVSNTAGNSGNNNSRTQRIRDPDLPKRPTNAYLIFCEMEKERIKHELEERNPGAVTELSKSLTEAWKNLDDEKRKPYYKLYEDDRDRYQREMAVYNQKKQIEEEQKETKKSNKKQKLDNEHSIDENSNLTKEEQEQDNNKIENTNNDSFAIDEQNNSIVEENEEDSAQPNSTDNMHMDQVGNTDESLMNKDEN